MKNIVLSLLVFGLTFQSFAQVVNDEKLPEVVVNFVNYKYIGNVGTEDGDVSQGVELLEREVANYNIKKTDLWQLYQDEYELYNVTFYIPDGKIVAAYDKNGKIIRTIEKYKNVKLPSPVLKSVTKKYPGWSISNDVYKVIYHHENGVSKSYKLILEEGNNKIRVKTDENGKFI